MEIKKEKFIVLYHRTLWLGYCVFISCIFYLCFVSQNKAVLLKNFVHEVYYHLL